MLIFNNAKTADKMSTSDVIANLCTGFFSYIILTAELSWYSETVEKGWHYSSGLPYIKETFLKTEQFRNKYIFCITDLQYQWKAVE